MAIFGTMSWKIAILVALLTGGITAIVTAPVADKMTKLHGVSDFEGGRGMAVAFLFIPAGFIGGLLLGLLGSKLVHATEWVHFWKALGLSVLLGQIALFGISGLSLLGIPRPPKLDGKTLSLEVEVHVPLARITERSREPDQIRMSLYAGPKDNRYATIDRARFREEGGMLIVTGVTGLNSRSYLRSISFHIEEGTWLAYEVLLPASPKAGDLEWTQLQRMHQAQLTNGKQELTDVVLRYRVVPGE